VRIAALVMTVFLLAGCSTPATVEPREYLDEQTAATITVVAEPLILVRATSNAREFLNLYAIDVNRMGQHQQYIAVLPWWSVGHTQPKLSLETTSGPVTLTPVTHPPREFGIAQAVDESAPRDATWWYFPADKALLDDIARSPALKARVHAAGGVNKYVLWRDASRQLNELAAILPE
jgi:hypothetical protein